MRARQGCGKCRLWRPIKPCLKVRSALVRSHFTSEQTRQISMYLCRPKWGAASNARPLSSSNALLRPPCTGLTVHAITYMIQRRRCNDTIRVMADAKRVQ